MISRTKLRVGLIGAGHICPFHIQALQRLDAVEIVGITDCVIERAEHVARHHRLRQVYPAVDALLDDADVVHVLTPPDDHAALTLNALSHGCHVFVEKPLATRASDCDEIIAAAKQHGRIVGVDHSLLLDPFTLRAQQIVESGQIGKVHSVECLRAQDYPPYEGGPVPDAYRDGGYPFRDLGIHSLYQIEAFLGPIRHVQWMIDHLGQEPALHFDEWQAMVRCERGSAHLRISWNARPLQDLILIHGSRGTVKLDRFGMSVTVKRQNRLPEHPRRAFNAIAEAASTSVQVPLNLARIATKRIRRYHGLQAMVTDFYRRLLAGEAPLAGPEDAKRIGDWSELIAADADRSKASYLADFNAELSAPILLTGATGLIGRQLLKRLLQQGKRVRILSRRPPADELLANPCVEVVLGDLGDSNVVDRAIAGVECVYHVGGVIHGSVADFVRGNVVGTQNVVNSCLTHKVKQLIYISSLSVLQAIRSDTAPIDETCPLEAEPELRGLYTQTKLQAEQVVTRAVRQFGLPAVLLRPGEVIGEGAPLLSAGVGQRKGNWLIIFGDGRLEVPLIDVQDLVDAVEAAREHEITDGSIIHLVDPHSTTQNEMAGRYSEMTGETLRRIHVPRLVIYALGWCVQTVFGLLKRSAPLSVYRLRSALTPRHYDMTLAQQRLGWVPRRGITEGLRATMGAEQEIDQMKQRGTAQLVSVPITQGACTDVEGRTQSHLG